MEQTYILIQNIIDILFGIPLICVLLGFGLFFTIYLIVPQVRFFWHSIRILAGRYSKLRDFDEEPSIFKSFCTSIATPIGLGSVAGVAIAISTGGAGAVFWMVVAGFIGMSTKLVSLVANLSKRDQHNGKNYAGPMFLIKNALPANFRFFAYIFSILLVIATFVAGNLFQTNQMFAVIPSNLEHTKLITAAIIMVLTGLTIFKTRKIETIVNNLAPIFVVLYIVGAIGIIFINYRNVPDSIALIFNSAFGIKAVGGSAIGLSFRHVITVGVRRALFANEAGLGTNALSARSTDINSVQHAIAGMLGSFIDTIVTCLLTALIILSTGVWDGQISMQGITLVSEAFTKDFGLYGQYGIICFVWLFAFSTILNWHSHGVYALKFLTKFKEKKLKKIYSIIFVLICFFGPLSKLGFILNLADSIFAVMLMINLFACTFLIKEIRQKIRKYRKDVKAERI